MSEILSTNDAPMTASLVTNILNRIVEERKNQRCFAPMFLPVHPNDDDLVK